MKNSVSQSHQPHFRCAVAPGDGWLPLCTAQSRSLHSYRKFYCSIWMCNRHCWLLVTNVHTLFLLPNNPNPTLLSFNYPCSSGETNFMFVSVSVPVLDLWCFFLFKFRFFFLLLIFCLHCMACGILVPRPGMEPVAPVLGAQSLNHWTTREVLLMLLHSFQKPRL